MLKLTKFILSVCHMSQNQSHVLIIQTFKQVLATVTTSEFATCHGATAAAAAEVAEPERMQECATHGLYIN